MYKTRPFCGPSPWTTPVNNPQLLNFNQRSKRILATLNRRKCVNKFILTGLKDLLPIFVHIIL